LIVANSDSKDLTALSLRTAEIVGQLTLSDHLSALAASGTRVWYTLPNENLVGVVETTDMTRQGAHATAGLQQDGLFVLGKKVYVANGASKLVVELREETGSIIRGHRTGATPKAMCAAAGRLWVTNFNGRSVSGIPL
jgi:outer membrane protein assembly factor BamB